MAYEIPVTGSIRSRYHRQVIWKARQSKLLLKIDETFFLKTLDSLLPFEFLDTEGELWIHIIDYQRETVQLTEIYLHLDKYCHALLKRRACDRLEIWSNESVFGCPDDGIDLGDKTFFITLRKLKIAMSAGTRLYCTDFRLDPQTVGKKRFYPLFKPCLKLK